MGKMLQTESEKRCKIENKIKRRQTVRKQKKNSRNYGMTGEDKDGKDKKAETGAGSDRALA